ncbi:GH24600 [Drosophila grimshawi]|uniref:GH24600 n=1 Tax=Drosophila grimshawi TaxID=7222 RepID=B4JM95_DROGR|nr:GH24600 [Drosophila grimshawi]
MIEPDARRGVIYLQYDQRRELHFCWKDRDAGSVEVDIVTVPGNLEFRRVEPCKTGRVYVLKFRGSTNRMFFWMQDPRHNLDDVFCARVNELLNAVQMPTEKSTIELAK